jgi:hypothetical protein
VKGLDVDWSTFFDRLSEAGQFISALAISIGVFIAWRQLSTWRDQSLSERRAEIAIEIVGLAHEIKNSFDEVRTPSELISVDADDPEGKLKRVQARLDRLFATNAEFDRLAKLRIRQRLIIGSQEVDELVKEFHEIRTMVLVLLSRLIRHHKSARYNLSERELERIYEAEDAMYGAGNSEDSIEKRLIRCIEGLEKALGQYAKFGR